jgi:hypothetical protein
LRDLYRSYVGSAAVLFTTDGPSYSYVSKGHIPGVLSTIDFGVGCKLNKTNRNLLNKLFRKSNKKLWTTSTF